MKKISKFFIYMLCLFMLANTTVKAEKDQQGDIHIVIGEGQNTPKCVYGKDVTIKIPLINEGADDASDVVIAPILDSSTDVFPFEIKKMNYDKSVGTLSGSSTEKDRGKRTKTVEYKFTTRDDVKSGYMKVSFLITYKDAEKASQTVTKDIFVKTEGAPEPTATPAPTTPPEPTNPPDPVIPSDPMPEPEPPYIPDPGPGPEPEEGLVSVPRVIISGFSTEPGEVKAGESFRLVLNITNTSSKTSVSNLEFNILSETEGMDEATAAAAFLPVAGSNTIFLSSIGKEETKEIAIEMTAKADLAQKPYVLNVGMKYEDSKANQYTSDASVSIPVKQEARLDMSEPQVMPDAIMVGSESNVMFSIINTGKTKLYNVSVEFLSDSISGGNTFVGNVEPGATGNVDTMIMGQVPTTDEGIVKVMIHYEDEAGIASTLEKEIVLFVNEQFMEVDNPMFPEEGLEDEKSSSKLPIIIAIILLIIGAGVGAFVIIKRKRRMEEIEEEMEEGIEDEIS